MWERASVRCVCVWLTVWLIHAILVLHNARTPSERGDATMIDWRIMGGGEGGAFHSVPGSSPPKQDADHALRHVALPEQWTRAGQIQR